MTSVIARRLVDACQGVIFDFDDTIMATFEIRSKSLIRTYQEFNTNVTREEVLLHWGLPFDELIHSLAPQIHLAQFLERYRRVMGEASPILLPGVMSLFQFFDSQGVPRIIHSSSRTDLVWQDILASHLASLVTDVYGCDRTTFAKPDPRSLEAIMESFRAGGLLPQQLLYIGDSVRDLQVARGNGIPFLGVLTGQTTRHMFNDDGFFRPIVDSLAIVA
jgi:phosphoglycolate phosphatase-like HAD superfamily hydrolase